MRIAALFALALIFFPTLGGVLGMALGAIVNLLRRSSERSADVGSSKDWQPPADNTSRCLPRQISPDRILQHSADPAGADHRLGGAFAHLQRRVGNAAGGRADYSA